MTCEELEAAIEAETDEEQCHILRMQWAAQGCGVTANSGGGGGIDPDKDK